MKTVAFVILLVVVFVSNLLGALDQASAGNGYWTIAYTLGAVYVTYLLVAEFKHRRPVFFGYLDEYGTIWDGAPGASRRVGDAIQRSDEETFEIWICR